MKKVKILFGCISIVAICAIALCSCAYTSKGQAYTILQLDLTESLRPAYASDSKYDDTYKLTVVDSGDNGEEYMAHPDAVLVNSGTDNEIIRTFYPAGHGKGAIIEKVSTDGGLTYSSRVSGLPESWKNSLETPTVYELNMTNGTKKLVLISANPKWWDIKSTGDGFNASISNDGGATWTEFEKFYGKNDAQLFVRPIVAMSALIQLKENGEFVDKWMGIFHDDKFVNYKTILSFNESGNMQWSVPEEYFKGKNEKGEIVSYSKIAKSSNMCEVELIRSDKGVGNRILLITRSNSKKVNSLISYSDDEGQTWSYPKEAPAALNGERHKAEYAPDGRLLISFRSIDRAVDEVKKLGFSSKGWYSQGLVAWVGTFDDLVNGKEGEYRIKLAHTYLENQTEPSKSANADTGYCGNVVLKDGTFVISSYGKFDTSMKLANNTNDYKTIIASKRINLSITDELVKLMRNN